MFRQIQLLWLVVLYLGPDSNVHGRTTLFTFHTSLVPWKAASRKCRELDPDSRLVTIDTESKANLIERLHRFEPWLNLTAVDYWIGLHDIDPTVSDFRWTRTCAQLGTWTNWHAGEPRNNSNYYCARNVMTEMNWRVFDCTTSAPFLCEKQTDEGCIFRTVYVSDRNASAGAGVVVEHKLKNETVSCINHCSDTHDCWVWYSEGDYCVLFYSNTTMFPENSVHHDDYNSATPYDIFFKECYTAEISTSTVSFTGSEIELSPNVCQLTTTTEDATTTPTTSPTSTAELQTTTTTPTNLQTTTIDRPTARIDTTELQTTVTRRDTSVTIVTTAPSTMPETKVMTSPSTTTTTTDLQTTTTDALTTREGTTKVQTTANIRDRVATRLMTTAATTTTIQPKPPPRVVAFECECYCDNVTIKEPAPTLTPRQKEEFVIQIVQSLTINISNISAARRKLMSAIDSRPSARRVGVIGIALLSVVFGGILILDLHGLVRDFRTLFHNIKSGLGYKNVGEDDKNT